MKKRVLFLLLCFAISSLKAATYFVSPNGNGTQSGADWDNAKTLADAITMATSGDVIFVLKGTYTAASGQPLINLTGAKSGIKLYGGFAGTETSLAQRVFGTTAADSTILKGNNNRVIYNNGTAAEPITSLLYDGFTIMNGFATSSGVGGGMCNLYASLTVTDCIFKENATNNGSGGGMYNSNNTVTVTNSKFYSNTAGANGGGGIIVSGGSSATITNCVFDSNKATHATSGTGGGVSTYTTASVLTNVTITNCMFFRNTAGSRGGGLFDSQYVTTNVSGCVFSDNTATNGGGMYSNTLASATITNCTFFGNIATNGGGMYNNEANPTVINCTFSGNETKSSGSGAGLYNYSTATAKFVNCLFSGNKAVNAGGGVYNGHAADKVCTPIFINCTIAGNNGALNGGGMWNTGPANSNTNPVITNCIIYGNNSGIGIWPSSGATATVTYSNVQYTEATNEADYANGTGNLNVDPKFINSPASSTAPFTTGDYTLQSTSPVINKGDKSAISGYSNDLAGGDRVYNDIEVDMGAYEYQGVLPVTLISFTGKLHNNQVRLNWVTASEKDNSHFNILRSANGKEFVNIGTVQGSGDSSTGNTYSFIDTNPQQGVNYYKLEQVDFDGQKSNSRIVFVTTEIAQSSLSVYGGDHFIQVNIFSITKDLAQLILTDISGRKVMVQQLDITPGDNVIKIPVALKSGIYIASVKLGAETLNTKFYK
ncbi:right-handed parallel beta-helix repeat-containing protein [Pseudopedobacter beijingensis]|uniref:Right-handed parallel beta-helix repeat-containing protein n=1 Tax=Pseudopedobacter beijingensis TaxID=1207056 RepID=A0ABW4IE34_9SPHI